MFWVRMHCGTYTVDVVPSHVGCWWMLDARAQRAQGTYEVVKNFLQDYWGTLAMPWGLRTTAIRCALCHRWQVRRGRTESIRNGWIAEKFVRLHLSSPAAAGMIHLLIHYDSLWFTMIHYDSLIVVSCLVSCQVSFISFPDVRVLRMSCCDVWGRTLRVGCQCQPARWEGTPGAWRLNRGCWKPTKKTTSMAKIYANIIEYPHSNTFIYFPPSKWCISATCFNVKWPQ